MKFSFRIGVYLVIATTIAMLVTIGGAYQLSVTEQAAQANAEANISTGLPRPTVRPRARGAAQAWAWPSAK